MTRFQQDYPTQAMPISTLTSATLSLSSKNTKTTTTPYSSTAKATSPITYTLYYGTFIHTPRLSELEINFNTLVGVNTFGEIDFIYKNFESNNGPQSPVEFFKSQYNPTSNISSLEAIEFVDNSRDLTKFFFPGFIDTHIHASQFPNIGIGLDTPLLDWLTTYTFAVELKFGVPLDSTDDLEKKIEIAKLVYSKIIDRTLSNGTTCASYFTTIDPETTNLFADLLLQHGQRGFVGKVCMDHNKSYPTYEESLSECEESMQKIISHCQMVNPPGETLVKPIVTPRFAPLCSKKMLRYLGRLSNEQDLPIQTHISENKQEIELVKQLFPESESYSQVYNKYNLLNLRTILAHAIHLSQKECDLVAGQKCSISHCPTSNSFISSGEAPVRKYLYEDKINVSLGTDVSGGFDTSILQIVKHAILVSHHLSMKDTKDVQQSNENCKLSISDGLFMSTLGGAKAVGLKDTVGTFAVGKRFDAQLIDLGVPNSNTDVFNWQLPFDGGADEDQTRRQKVLNLLGKWVFSGDDRNCVKVWCNGRLVIDKEA